MEIQRMPLGDLSPDPSNARRHPERNLDAIIASLRKFGQQKPIVVDGRGIVVAGNGTFEAAKRLGWSEIAVVRTDLAGIEATAFAIADNRTAELAEWDFKSLGSLFKCMIDAGLDTAPTGFSAHEIEPLLQADWSAPAPGKMPAEPLDMHTYYATNEQREVIDRAVAKVRNELPDASVGRALELICADYLAGAA